MTAKKKPSQGALTRKCDRIERFVASFEVTPAGCWEWCRSVQSAGYGQFYADGRNHRAHRYAYELWVGPIPPGLTLDHLCRNKLCVCPEHLEPVTHRINILRSDGRAAKNAAKTHCIHGHAFTPDNTIVRPSGRQCRICARRANSDYYYRKTR